MSWVVLFVSGVLEAVWATALDRCDGFTRVGATVLFVGALIASMAGLAWAMRELPIGTSYAVWVGIGAVLTIGYAMLTGQEAATLIKLGLVAMIVAGVVGLKLTH